MTTEIVVALIAFIGVATSAGLSYFISNREIKSGLDRLNAERVQQIGVKLIEQRIALYPIIYNHLSRFYKALRFGSVSKEAVDDLYRQLDEWTNQYAIFYSEKTSDVSYRLYKELIEINKLNPERFNIYFESDDTRKKLEKTIVEFKRSLESEIGSHTFITPIGTETFEWAPAYKQVEGVHQQG